MHEYDKKEKNTSQRSVNGEVPLLNRRTFMATSSAVVAASSLLAGQSFAEDALITEQRKTTMKDSATITLVQLQAARAQSPAMDRIPAFFETAASLGSDLIVFPEYVLGDLITTAHENAQRFFDLARTHRINAIIGCVEVHGDKYATSAWVVNREGLLLGRYLKSHPAAGPGPHWWPPVEGHDREARGVLGSQFKVFHLDFGPIAILQCYDGYFPEAWGCTSYAGAEVILWINGRDGMVEDAYCITAAQCYGCVVGGNITDGFNTGFACPGVVTPVDYADAPEESRLYPRIKSPGDACVTATIDLAALRHRRKHLRTMHQRRPDMYGLLTQDVKMWQDYPEIPWDYPECADLVNRAQLP